MSNQRKLHLNAFLNNVGHHEAAWRLPESNPLGGDQVEFYIRLARIAETAKLDSIFFADAPVVWGTPGCGPPACSSRRCCWLRSPWRPSGSV